MIAKLLILVPLLVAPYLKGEIPIAVSQRAEDAASDCLAAVGSLYPSADDESKIEIARRWYMMSYYESSFFTDPKGSNDDGAACGVLQVHLPKAECAEARRDRVYAYTKGIELGERWVKACGSVEAGLSAYATGACPKPGKVLSLIRWRCKRIGGC